MIRLIGIELLLSLPDHVFRYMIQSYLGLREILYLDTAVTNHLYRDEILLKIKDVLIKRADFHYIHSYINWMNLRVINVDLLYISLSQILFLLYGMQYNIENIMHILKRCISKSRKIVMDFSHCTITNESLIDTISDILNVNNDNKNNNTVHGVKKSEYKQNDDDKCYDNDNIADGLDDDDDDDDDDNDEKDKDDADAITHCYLY